MVNLFITDFDPLVAARDSCDIYTIKIPVEVGTLLSAIHWRTNYKGPVGSGLPLNFAENCRVIPAIGPYKNSKVIKSSSETYRWLIKSTGNYYYAVAYGLELIEEYKKRYKKLHLTEGVLLWLKENVPDIPQGPMTKDVGLAMPEKYKDRNDPTHSYKKYLIHEKYKVLQWKHGRMPDWYRKMKNIFGIHDMPRNDCSKVKQCSMDNCFFSNKTHTHLVCLREFANDDLSDYYRKEFVHFAETNYPGINTKWTNEDTEFTALIESGSWRVIGLLVVKPYDGDKIHINLLAIAEDYRGRSFGTKLLMHIAAKYPNDEITLNVAFDRSYLVDFYCRKGYATQKEVVTQEKVIILSLVHVKLLKVLPAA